MLAHNTSVRTSSHAKPLTSAWQTSTIHANYVFYNHCYPFQVLCISWPRKSYRQANQLPHRRPWDPFSLPWTKFDVVLQNSLCSESSLAYGISSWPHGSVWGRPLWCTHSKNYWEVSSLWMNLACVRLEKRGDLVWVPAEPGATRVSQLTSDSTRKLSNSETLCQMSSWGM